MPIIQGNTSVALSSTNDNVLTGSQFEFVPFPAQIDFGLNGDTNGTDLRVDVYSGNDILAENLIPNTNNTFPKGQDDFLLTDVADKGERLKIRVRNTSAAAARSLFWCVRITPL